MENERDMALAQEANPNNKQPERRDAAWGGGWPQTYADFERLVDCLQHRLVRYAFFRLGDHHDAEDVVQDVFLRAYADRARRKNVQKVTPYLYRMTDNGCTDLLRKRKSRNLSLDETADMEIPSKLPDASELAAAAQQAQRVEGWLNRLPSRQAKVIRLKIHEDLSIREIAEILGCSRATVKSRMRYGLEKLRRIISRQGEVLK